MHLAVGLCGLLALAGASHGQQEVEIAVTLDVSPSADESMPSEVEVSFSEASTRAPAASHVVDAGAVRGPQDFHVAVPASESGSGWFAWARAPGWWSSSALVAPEDRKTSLALVPAGVVRFSVLGTDRGVDQLDSGSVWIAGIVAQRKGRLDRGIHGGPCEIDKESDPRAVLIACPFARDETVDLRVRLGPFLPVLRPALTIGADTDLGLIEPVRGASVTGYLAAGDGASYLFGLRPDAPQAFPWSAWTDAGGVFRFEGLSPGAYELLLLGSDSETWPVRIESLADHVDLGQLSSAAANLLAVSFVAPSAVEVDHLRPTLRSATLGPDGDVVAKGRTFEVDDHRADGAFLWRGLPTGDYEVNIEDDRGNRWGQHVVRSFGQDHHHLELDAVPLVGRIRRGGEPLQDVAVWFGGLWGVERVSFRSREEGRFSGLLPRDGFWPVEVTPAPDCDPCEGGWDTDGWGDFDDSVVDDAGFFQIEADADGVARVEIELSAGTISGRVAWRDPASGQVEPVERAHVWIHAVEEVAGEQRDLYQPSTWRRKTSADGAFHVTGLPEWEYSVSAEGAVSGRELRSREVLVRVAEGDPIDDLKLLLEALRPVTVVVRSGGVPVSGAQTFVLYPAGSARPNSNGHTRSAGTVTHHVPMEAEFVDVVARAEGLGMNGRRFWVGEGAPLMLDLAPDRGSLRIPKRWDARLATPDGAMIEVDTLYGVNDRHGQVQEDGDEFIVGDLVHGTWSWCPSDGVCSKVEVLPWAESKVSQ